jgi:hypothetical protein
MTKRILARWAEIACIKAPDKARDKEVFVLIFVQNFDFSSMPYEIDSREAIESFNSRFFCVYRKPRFLSSIDFFLHKNEIQKFDLLSRALFSGLKTLSV